MRAQFTVAALLAVTNAININYGSNVYSDGELVLA